MNGKLIFSLSLFGVVMAFSTTYFISSRIEPFCWLAIFIINAWLIAKHAPGKFFLHGFLVCIVDWVWMTAVHIWLSSAYMATHAKEAAHYAKLNRDIGMTPAMTMLVMAPFVGIAYGLILGLFSIMARGIYGDR